MYRKIKNLSRIWFAVSILIILYEISSLISYYLRVPETTAPPSDTGTVEILVWFFTELAESTASSMVAGLDKLILFYIVVSAAMLVGCRVFLKARERLCRPLHCLFAAWNLIPVAIAFLPTEEGTGGPLSVLEEGPVFTLCFLLWVVFQGLWLYCTFAGEKPDESSRSTL